MVEENYSEYKVTATKKSVLVKNPSFCTQPRMVTLDNPAVQPAGRELLRLAEAVPGTPHHLQATINMHTICCTVQYTCGHHLQATRNMYRTWAQYHKLIRRDRLTKCFVFIKKLTKNTFFILFCGMELCTEGNWGCFEYTV